MIIVKVELWPFGIEAKAKEIGRMTISNKGTTTFKDPSRGDYSVKVMRRGTTDRVLKTGLVTDYPRNSYPIWELVKRAWESVK